MRLKRTFRLFAGLLVLPVSLVASLPSLAADEQPTGGRVSTVTRLVKLFLEKEASFGAAREPTGSSRSVTPVPQDHPHSRSRVGAQANRKFRRSISAPQSSGRIDG